MSRGAPSGLGDLALLPSSAPPSVRLVADAVAARRREGRAGGASARPLAEGPGWRVLDVLCDAGPGDRPFEEHHEAQSLSLVLAGGFSYRSGRGGAALQPGAILLGEAGCGFACGHAHGEGDRCLSFHYDPDFFDALAGAAAGRGRARGLPQVALPPDRSTSALAVAAELLLAGADRVEAQELALVLAERVALALAGLPPHAPERRPLDARQARRVAAAVRHIESRPDEDLSLAVLARQACLSPYHFLRLFRRHTGTTPQAYVQLARLRAAAVMLRRDERPVIEIALAAGFGDLSHFTTSFRRLFGLPPGAWRKAGRTKAGRTGQPLRP